MERDVDRAELVDGGREEVVDVGRVAHVDGHEAAVDLGCGRGTGVGVEVGDHDAGPFASEAPGRREPDAAAAARDDRDASGQAAVRVVRSHGSAPSR